MIVQLFATTTLKLTIILMITACFLPYLCALLAKRIGGFDSKDNKTPREFLAQTTGLAARLNHAQANGFENLPIFLAAVIIALYTFVPISLINLFATGFILFRLGFIASYASNLSLLRSITWFLALACCLALFILSYMVG